MKSYLPYELFDSLFMIDFLKNFQGINDPNETALCDIPGIIEKRSKLVRFKAASLTTSQVRILEKIPKYKCEIKECTDFGVITTNNVSIYGNSIISATGFENSVRIVYPDVNNRVFLPIEDKITPPMCFWLSSQKLMTHISLYNTSMTHSILRNTLNYRQQLVAQLYSFLNNTNTENMSYFFNNGYIDVSTPSSISSKMSYDDLCSNLYITFLKPFLETTHILKILEVSCGMGGGLFALQSLYTHHLYYGIDLKESFIEYAKSKRNTCIHFDVGNALELKYDSNSFDIVVNIEASHNYGNYDLFFSQVYRILKQNGTFVYIDFFMTSTDYYVALENLDKKFEIIRVHDLSKNIIASRKLWKKTKTFDYLKNDMLKVAFGLDANDNVVDYGLKNGFILYMHFICVKRV